MRYSQSLYTKKEILEIAFFKEGLSVTPLALHHYHVTATDFRNLFFFFFFNFKHHKFLTSVVEGSETPFSINEKDMNFPRKLGLSSP